MNEPDLDQAMDRYARGDAGAFAALHRALYPRLLGYLARETGSATLAADLVQETMLRVHRARGTFAPGGAVAPWVYAIARNVRTDHARAARLRGAEELRDGDLADRGPDAESAAIASQAADAAARALAHLPAAQREAFVLLRWEGLSVEDAAAVVGVSKTALKLRAFRAYEALRAALDVAPRRAPAAKPNEGRRGRSARCREVRRSGPGRQAQPHPRAPTPASEIAPFGGRRAPAGIR